MSFFVNFLKEDVEEVLEEKMCLFDNFFKEEDKEEVLEEKMCLFCEFS